MKERTVSVKNGWVMLGLAIAVQLATIGVFLVGCVQMSPGHWVTGMLLVTLASFMQVGCVLLYVGFFTLQPNEARVLVLFGRYVGTVKEEGFHWANPFSVCRKRQGVAKEVEAERKAGVVRPFAMGMGRDKYRVSLRARNFETQHLKVNDQRGNPIEIGAVVVWRVEDTAAALFNVDEYENYVTVQSETAVRHLASSYPYDQGQDGTEAELTLRGSGDAVNAALKKELEDRLARAGAAVEEARLTHLAYAPEIAGAMLRRQQAEAIIAARQKIVHGAVSMVEMALSELSEREVVHLDEERKAAMVGNLLVVLCGLAEAEPVINTGTLYH
jgi:regulator of protease activity HflC (stomatin/prohibitin superfamily)